VPAFDITTTTSEIPLTAGQGRADFTVTNTTGRAISARADLEPLGNTDPTWLKVEGSRTRDFADKAAEKITVLVSVPEKTPAGAYSFRLSIVATSESASEFNQASEPVGFTAPGPVEEPTPVVIITPPPPRSIWMLVSFGLVFVAVVLLMLIVFVLVRGDGDEPTAAPTPTPLPTLPNLVGTSWDAVLVGGTPPVSGNAPILAFGDGTIRYQGCNGWEADARVLDHRLQVTQPIRLTTSCFCPSCPPAFFVIEQSFRTIVAAGGDLSLDPTGRLVLAGPEGQVIFTTRP
jgi:hypothetical protein